MSWITQVQAAPTDETTTNMEVLVGIYSHDCSVSRGKLIRMLLTAAELSLLYDLTA